MSRKAVRLADVTEVITKGTTPTTLGYDFAETGVPFLRVQNIEGGSVNYERDTLFIDERTHGALKRSQIKPGDVLVSIAGTIGRSGLVPDNAPPLNCNQAVAIVRSTEQIFRPFLRLWLESSEAQKQMRGASVTGTISNLSLTQVGDLEIPLPPLAEQQRIADVLDRAEALRAKRRAALAQLDSLTQSFFLDLFGDPVSNPKRWPQENLETFFHFKTGKLDSNAAVASGQYPFFTCSREHYQIDTYAFDCEALLLAGNNASADYSVKHYKGKFDAYQRTYVITLRDMYNSYDYARFVLEQRLAELKRISKGTNTKYLTMELLNRIRIPVPPQELQHEFARRVQAVEKLKAAHRASLAELDALFASLQHRAFRGEL